MCSKSTTSVADEFFGLKIRATGEIVRLENEGDRYCLSARQELPHFRAQTLMQLERVLLASTPWYNTSEERPGWGNFEATDLIAAKVRLVTIVKDVDMLPVLSVETFYTMDVSAVAATRHAGREVIADGMGRLVSWIVFLPESVTLDEFRILEGQHVYSKSDSSTRRKVYAVSKVPGDFLPELRGRPGALLIASESRHE